MRYLTPVALAALIVALMGALWLLLAGSEPPRLGPQQPALASLLPQPRPLHSVDLIDQDGQPFGEERLQGKWTLMFFGYTHCPDFCPTTMAVLKAMRERLEPPERERLQVVFVSVDPDRDTPEAIRRFVRFFDPEVLGATGSRSAIDALAAQLGVIYGFDRDTAAGYIVNHSASILLIDPKVRWYARFSPPHEPAGLAQELRKAREYYSD